MKLSDNDLQQLDEAQLQKLKPEQKERLLVVLLNDLKEARERLKADSHNSSRPPRSNPVWLSTNSDSPEATADEPSSPVTPEAARSATADTPKSDDPASASAPAAPQKRTVGRQRGAPGHGRELMLPVSSTQTHRPSHCIICGNDLTDEPFHAHSGHYVIDLDITPHSGLAGIRVTHEKHLYGEVICPCGHHHRSEPGYCADDPLWKKLSLNERCLVGPQLASLIVCLAQRMRQSRRQTQEFLHDWLGISLSTSTINHCIHEAGRAVEPLEEALVQELISASLLHADETPWKEWGKLLWLWVIISPTVCLYLIGDRSKELLANVFGEQFSGWLMSDGYQVYRKFKHRLRCWAHIIRKARGLEEAFHSDANAFGKQVNRQLEQFMQAIYQARESPPTVCLTVTFEAELLALKQLCGQYRDSKHDKTKALARELLNDWEAFWIVLQYPHLPLTNNEAERALRHWVIARLISQGTRTEQGTRAFGLLASVIETCRKRKVLPWPYLASVIAERRKGNTAPSLPVGCVA
jgi:hypothetical protein